MLRRFGVIWWPCSIQLWSKSSVIILDISALGWNKLFFSVNSFGSVLRFLERWTWNENNWKCKTLIDLVPGCSITQRIHFQRPWSPACNNKKSLLFLPSNISPATIVFTFSRQCLFHKQEYSVIRKVDEWFGNTGKSHSFQLNKQQE